MSVRTIDANSPLAQHLMEWQIGEVAEATSMMSEMAMLKGLLPDERADELEDIVARVVTDTYDAIKVHARGPLEERIMIGRTGVCIMVTFANDLQAAIDLAEMRADLEGRFDG